MDLVERLFKAHGRVSERGGKGGGGSERWWRGGRVEEGKGFGEGGDKRGLGLRVELEGVDVGERKAGGQVGWGKSESGR